MESESRLKIETHGVALQLEECCLCGKKNEMFKAKNIAFFNSKIF
jgi:hypothetical protein